MIRMRRAALHHGSMCLTSCDERSGQGQNTGAKSQDSRYAIILTPREHVIGYSTKIFAVLLRPPVRLFHNTMDKGP